jgi:broad specificity phosphatase PhoE
MTLLILIRHSIPDYQPEINSHDWALSQVGVMLCKRMADMIRSYEPTRVFASVEPKATQTGQLIAEHLALPFETVEGLQEQSRRTERWYDDLRERQNDIMKIFAEPESIVYGEESGVAAYKRFANAINDLRSRYSDETMAVVTHGTVMALFLEREANLNGPDFWMVMGCPMFVVLSPAETGYMVVTVENNVRT